MAVEFALADSCLLDLVLVLLNFEAVLGVASSAVFLFLSIHDILVKRLGGDSDSIEALQSRARGCCLAQIARLRDLSELCRPRHRGKEKRDGLCRPAALSGLRQEFSRSLRPLS